MNIKETVDGLMFFKQKLFNGIFSEKISCFDEAITALEELQQYRAIGTVEECKVARERMKQKKSNSYNFDFSYFECPNCGNLIYFTDDVATHKFCLICGQALSWESD